MKQIADVIKAVNNEEFYVEQFQEFADDTNILFMSPQLSGKQLYKIFLPFCGMYNTTNLTSLTSIEKYNPREQLVNINLPIKSKDEILWADYVIIPFTTQSLTNNEFDLYDSIRSINNSCKIVFSIDFNFYDLSDNHPYKDIFTQEVIETVEESIWYSDLCLVTNMAFRKYLIDKMTALKNGRMSGINTEMGVACMPFFIDIDIVTANVDYEIQEPQKMGVKPTKPKKVKPQRQELTKITKTANTPKKETTKRHNKQIRVVKEDGKWVLMKGENVKPIEVYAKKSLAVDETQKFIDKGFDVIIYKTDGTIQKSIIFKHQKK